MSLESLLSLLPDLRGKKTPFVILELSSPVPGECWLTTRNLTTRNPTVQVELISGYMDCLLESGKLKFPSDLTGIGPPLQLTRPHIRSANTHSVLRTPDT